MSKIVQSIYSCYAALCVQSDSPEVGDSRNDRAKTLHYSPWEGSKNPLTDTPTNIEDGRVAFSHYCAACHGLDGQNTGVPFADRMAPPVPLLNSKQVQSYSDGQLNWIIENGISPSGMPASKGILSDSEVWSIVVYIRHLPQAGSLGEPVMYSGDEDASSKQASSTQKR
jgi:mono/diheme cytochrome c family protein